MLRAPTVVFMDQWLQGFHDLITASELNLWLSLKLVAVFWVIHLLNLVLGMRLNIFGIIPRKRFGLFGIVCSPFLHGNTEHLFFNSIALFILFDLMLVGGLKLFILATLMIILIGDSLVWLFARRGIHIGASGLIMGYWMFLLVNAYYQHSVIAVILAVLCLYYLAGLGLSLIPGDVGTSWEAHIFGALGGVLAVYGLQYIM